MERFMHEILRMKRRRLIHNLTSSNDRRKELRESLTPAEAFLWKHLKNSQLDGKKFRRQHSIGPYIVDFFVRNVGWLLSWMARGT